MFQVVAMMFSTKFHPFNPYCDIFYSITCNGLICLVITLVRLLYLDIYLVDLEHS